LIRQVEDDQIVALMIDEAQNLSGELLEEVRLLSNLETDTQKLLQIVLVGQPEFEERLDQAQLLRLKQRVALRCRLRRLERYEIGPYIDARLKAVHCERRDLFDSESVTRIGLYSKGNPRIINVICDNALLIAFAASASCVSVKQIDEAAHELKLQDEHQGGSLTYAGDLQKNTDAGGNLLQSCTHSLNEAGITADRWRTDFEPPSVDIGQRPIRSRRSKRSRVREAILLILIMTIGAAFVVTEEHGHLSFPEALNYIDKLAVFVREVEQAPGQLLHPLETQNTSNGGSKVLPTLDNPPRPTEDLREAIVPPPDTTGDGEPENVPPVVSEKPLAKNSPEINDSKRQPVKRHPPVNARDDERLRTRKLEFEIYKAIHDRAIRGVEVSVSDDTVYLDGRVATPQQILAAVRATLTVPGVKNIRNRIVVDG
jgi:hypothetical protein